MKKMFFFVWIFGFRGTCQTFDCWTEEHFTICPAFVYHEELSLSHHVDKQIELLETFQVFNIPMALLWPLLQIIHIHHKLWTLELDTIPVAIAFLPKAAMT